ncbi:MAG: hypothetical protein RJB38_872 [Pseudomonadota bacterium]
MTWGEALLNSESIEGRLKQNDRKSLLEHVVIPASWMSRVFLIAVLLASSMAYGDAGPLASEVPVTLVRPSPELSGLSYNKYWLELPADSNSLDQRSFIVRLSGELRRRRSRVFMNDQLLRESRGGFEVKIPIRSAVTSVVFSIVDFRGRIEKEEVSIQVDFDRASEFQDQALGRLSKAAWSVGVNSSWMSYRDDLGNSLEQIGLGMKLSFSRPLNSKRKSALAANLYGTLIPVVRRPGDLYLQVLGLNFRYGVQLKEINHWRVWLFGGYFYTTTFAPSSRIGYIHQLGPQIYPTVTFKLSDHKIVAGYLKFAQLANIGDFKNREIALGISYHSTSDLKRNRSISFDYSTIHVLADFVTIDLSSAVIGYSLSL